MLPKPIDGLTFSDVAAMVEAGGLREGRTLDLKQAPVGGKDDDKRVKGGPIPGRRGGAKSGHWQRAA